MALNLVTCSRINLNFFVSFLHWKLKKKKSLPVSSSFCFGVDPANILICYMTLSHKD